VSAFYKRLQNHIELGFGTAGITWENIPLSTVAGIELEGKKSLGKSFELRANITFVKSEAEFVRRGLQIVNGRKEYTIIDTLFRPMFGQAPYLINAIASYKWDEKGFVLTASYNVQGPRLVIAGAIEGIANVFELPRNLIDVKASKTLGKHFSVSLTVRDILNAAVDRSYDLPTGWEPFDRFRFGTSFNLGIAYKY
jgi:outer membrane receptor protein involved in Fe transport